MLARLILGVGYVATIWAIAGLAASSGSIVLICIAGLSLAVGTMWSQRQWRARSSISTKALTAFNIVGLVGAIVVTDFVADDRLRYWFAGAVIFTYFSTIAFIFFKPDGRHERTR